MNRHEVITKGRRWSGRRRLPLTLAVLAALAALGGCATQSPPEAVVSDTPPLPAGAVAAPAPGPTTARRLQLVCADEKSANLASPAVDAAGGRDAPEAGSGATRVVLNGTDVTEAVKALVPFGRLLQEQMPGLAEAAKRFVEQQQVARGDALGKKAAAGVPTPKPAESLKRPANAGGPCLELDLPADLGAIDRTDRIGVRFVRGAADIDVESLRIVGSRFGFERSLLDDVRRHGAVSKDGIEMPLSHVPAGKATVSISVRDVAKREVRFTSEIQVRG